MKIVRSRAGDSCRTDPAERTGSAKIPSRETREVTEKWGSRRRKCRPGWSTPLEICERRMAPRRRRLWITSCRSATCPRRPCKDRYFPRDTNLLKRYMQFVSTFAAMFMQIRTFVNPTEGTEFNDKDKNLFQTSNTYYDCVFHTFLDL